MDVDISDILEDISRPSQQFTGPSTTPYSAYDGQSAYTDHVLLTRAWTSERCAPTLLPYPSTLIARVMDRIRTQIAKIEDLTAGTYDGTDTTTNTNGAAGGAHQANLNLTLSILQTDLSRTQFLVRSLLRQRLAKITKHATYYTKYHVNATSSGEDVDTKSPLLSLEETQFLTHHSALLKNLYDSSFLLSLPVNLRRLDDSTGGSARMDEGPDAAEGVMVRCLAQEWNNDREVVDGEMGNGTQAEEEKATVEVGCARGEILVARWRDVRGGVERGELEVL